VVKEGWDQKMTEKGVSVGGKVVSIQLVQVTLQDI